MASIARFQSLLLFLLVSAVGFSSATGGLQAAEEGSQESDVEHWVSAWVEIWNTYDLSRVNELFLRDNSATYFSSEKEGLIIGIDAIREHHRGFGFVEGGKQQPNKLWLEGIHTETFGTTAVVTAIWYFERPDRTVQRGPVTIVYVRQGEAYRIAHMNFSTYGSESK